MPQKKYIVELTKSERQLTKKGKIAAKKMNHARILLLYQLDYNLLKIHRSILG